MRKKPALYIIAFIPIVIVLLIFNRAYRDITTYSELTQKQNTIQICFQNLSRQIKNAAILSPDLTRASDSLGVARLFFADSQSTIHQLVQLREIILDSVNIAIAEKLDPLIRAEIAWLLRSNVPDSIINHKSTAHIVSYQLIDSLINRGIQRTAYLTVYRDTQLRRKLDNTKLWVAGFIIVSGLLLIYTIIDLFSQQATRRRKERELETVFNRISDGVVSVSSDWRYTFLNDAALSTHPLGRKQTLGKVMWEVHPEMADTIFWDKYHEAMQTRKVVEIAEYYAPMDIWFSVKVYPSSDGLTIFYKDVSENKKAELQLSRTLREVNDYKFALDESSIVAITDHKGIIKHANENFCKISKYSLSELIGQDHRIINSGYHSKEFIKNLWTTIANGRIWKGELKNKAKDGTVYWVDTTIVPFLNEQGKPYQYIAIRADVTERKRVEENLEKSLKELADYKYALDESSIVAITDQKGIIKYVNDNFCRISKYSRQDLIGQDHRIINSGHHSKEFIRGLWVTIANGKIWKGELKNKAKDGTIYWVDTTIVPFLDEQQKPYQYIAIRADITERKLAEEKLASSEMHFRSLIENSAEGIVLTDEFSNTLYRSPAGKKLMGDLPSENSISRTHPDDLESLKTLRAEIFKYPGLPILFQGRFLHADGHYIWLECIFTNMLHVKGVNAIVTNFRDITQRREAEQKLIKSEKIYKTIASSIPGSVICLLDTDYRYLLIEGDMLTKLGYSKENLLGKKAAEVLPNDVFENVDDDLKRANAGITVIRESHMAGYDIITRFIPLVDERHEVYAIMTVAIDVTKLKNAQRDIAELNRDLEERIKTRTSQLKKSNEEMEAFSYSVSHDLRAPLRGILGFAAILEEEYGTKLDSEAMRIITVIRQNSIRMGQLIDDLLAFSRIGKKELQKTKVDTNVMVGDIIKEMAQHQNNHTIKWEIGELPDVNADTNTLRQVWINYLSNAVKYSSNAGPAIIQVGACTRNGQIVFSIKDNGVGFDEQYSNKLFKVFQRLHSSDEFEGTGIGLALVEKIVSKHGGSVWAEGKPEQGACFYFSLPL